MTLTAQQLAALKADILADPTLSAWAATGRMASEIADAYNLAATPAFVVWRSAVSSDEWAIPECLAGSVETALAESQKVVDWLEAESMVTRYAWFIDYQDPAAWWYPGNPLCDTSLVTRDGGLTKYGQWYMQSGG